MKRENWPVGDYAVRPVSADEQVCAYCQQPLGEQHAEGCVIRRRTVIVELRMQFVRLVTESDTEENINFWLNEGTRCADNTIEELYRRTQHWEHMTPAESDEYTGMRCFCSVASERYVREATAEDEGYHGVTVMKAIS